MYSIKNKKQGFTLIEMMVSVALFAIVVTIGTGSLLSIINGNKKAEALSSVISNVNFALESMVRDIRTGTNYECGGGTNCQTGGTSITFNSGINNGTVTYTFDGKGHITRSISCGLNLPPACVPENSENISSNEVNITNLTFYVSGALPGSADNTQPKVLIIIQGTAGKSKAAAPFNIETLVSQRTLDL